MLTLQPVDESIDYTPEQQVAYEQMLLANYDIDPTYFTEKYGVPVSTIEQPEIIEQPQDTGTTDNPNPQKTSENARAQSDTVSATTLADISGGRPFFD